jgi:hypothetical protein
LRLPSRPAHIAILAAALAAWFPIASLAETPRAVALALDGMRYVLARGGKAEVVVEAERADVSPQSGRIELSGVRARLGKLAGQSADLGGLELSCARGTLDLEAREFSAIGRVEGRTQDGRSFVTDGIRYRHDRGLVASDAPVLLSDEAGETRGGGFQFWVRENRFRVSGGATVVRRTE